MINTIKKLFATASVLGSQGHTFLLCDVNPATVAA